MEAFTLVARFFQNGGVFMYPILIIFAMGVSIALERIWYLTRARSENLRLWLHLVPLVNDGRYSDARALADRSKTAIGRVVGNGMLQSETKQSRAVIEATIEETLMEVMPQLERRTHYLATFANVATLLGLLGTIAGLIHGFAAIGGLDAVDKQSHLSEAVSEAMNCTAFGLLVAIPFMLLHAWLQSLTEQLVDNVEVAAVKFMNSVAVRG